MKIRSAEYLALVAIVTSAAVMQIREHVQDVPSLHAAQAMSCGAMHERNGLLPAGCEATRDTSRGERSADHAPQPQHSMRIWV